MECVLANKGRLKIGHIGAGVGVILYSAGSKVGAGLHILAPHSGPRLPDNPGMYANTAIPYILDQLENQKAKTPFSVALAGGATMLNVSDMASVGPRVVNAVKDALTKGHLTVDEVKDALRAADLNIKIEKTGGSNIRTMVLDIDAGKIKVT